MKNYPPFRCLAVLLSNGLGPGIDGSILSEHDISINFGLCRWAQYVNVLSDATTCDPGSVIAMAGMLGYEACGVPIWDQDVAVKPFVHLGRAYTCGQNLDGEMFDEATRQRKDQFSDTQARLSPTSPPPHPPLPLPPRPRPPPPRRRPARDPSSQPATATVGCRRSSDRPIGAGGVERDGDGGVLVHDEPPLQSRRRRGAPRVRPQHRTHEPVQAHSKPFTQ